MRQRFPVIVAALWWGSLTTVGFLVVPLLFAHLPTPALAGGMAARLFSAQSWVSLGCGLLLLMLARERGQSALSPWAQGALIFMAAGLLLAMLAEYGVAPRIVARDNLKLWHGVGTVVYALQWACAGAVLWKTVDQPADHPR